MNQRKLLRTKRALEGLLSRVDKEMSSQGASLRESLLTNGAFDMFCITMSVLVLIKSALFLEGFVANSTGKWPISRVR